jgi:exopolyphosphatase/guanosine-5'-triphosphate,3'-diphosphate pyrophosphatase
MSRVGEARKWGYPAGAAVKLQSAGEAARFSGMSVAPHNAGRAVSFRSARDEVAYAALDLGTNNCRLLVAVPQGEGFRVVESFSRIVRLGEGVTASGMLSPRAQDRALEALRICSARLARYERLQLRAVATEACRQASNGPEFAARVRRETGIPLEIIGTDEEARLALGGCASLLDGSAPHALVFDIGGGSTELIWRRNVSRDFHRAGNGHAEPAPANPLRYHSVPIGVVVLAERYGSDRIGEREYREMVHEAEMLLRPFEDSEQIGLEIAGRRVQMLGTSGTVTTLASVHLRLQRYSRSRVDGTYLDFPAIRAIGREIARLDCRGRAAMPCIGPQRADLVIGGIAILDAICRLWPVGRLRVADRGLREGMLHRLMQPERERSFAEGR